MNIQGTSQNTPIQGASQQGDPRLKSLDKQIADLQKRIRETRENEKLDPKSKAEKIKEYEQQIQLLQQEKAKIQAEERKNKQKTAEDDQTSVNENIKNKDQAIDDNVQKAFVQMNSMKKTETALGVIRKQAEGELRIAESKSFLSKPDPETAARARATIAKVDRFVSHSANEITTSLQDVPDESASLKERLEEEEADKEKAKSGTGRMEPGQFLNDEA